MRAPQPVRAYLIGLIIVVLVPLLSFSGFLVVRSAEHEQEVIASSVRNRTRVAAAAIEAELSSLRGRLFLLAGGLSPQTSDLKEFQTRAIEAFGSLGIVLSDEHGQEVIDTRAPFDEPLPKYVDQAAIRYVAETRLPRIGDMSQDPVTHQPFVSVNVPVTRDSRLVYVLSLDISSTLPGMLGQLQLPEGWIAAIFDRSGHMIARSRDADRFVGQLAGRSFLDRIQAQDSGWFAGGSREGVPLFTAFAHTRLGDWTVSVGIPRDILLAPIHHTTWQLALIGALTLALAIGLAIVIGKRIAAPITGLVPVAEAVGGGLPAVVELTPLTEVNVVAHSLINANERLQRVAAERQAATEALRQSEQKYRALAEDLVRAGEERIELLNRTVVAQEDERKRIARELHDGLAQYLTALRLGIDALGQPGPARPARHETVGELKALISELGCAVNRMAWELRPVALDDLGLRTAVDHYLEEWAERARLQVDTEINLSTSKLTPAVETTLFRILQEATTNVVRHAGASRVGVILEAREDEVRLIVEDDGKGFAIDCNSLSSSATKQFGLLGMRERLALVQGELDVESEPDCGATLFVRIPLLQRQEAR